MIAEAVRDQFLGNTFIENGCWEYRGVIASMGYGRIATAYAHRYSYERYVGPIAPGFQIDHLCRNRRCVNPAHLEAVTQTENIRRGLSRTAMNRRKTHCPLGHPYAGENLILVPRGGDRYDRRCKACSYAAMRLRYARRKGERHEKA